MGGAGMDRGDSWESRQGAADPSGGAGGVPGGEDVWEEGQEVWKGDAESASQAAGGAWQVLRDIGGCLLLENFSTRYKDVPDAMLHQCSTSCWKGLQ